MAIPIIVYILLPALKKKIAWQARQDLQCGNENETVVECKGQCEGSCSPDKVLSKQEYQQEQKMYFEGSKTDARGFGELKSYF